MQKTKNKMAVLSLHLSIATLNENGLKKCKWIERHIKRHIVAEWIKKNPVICCLQEIHFKKSFIGRQ